MSRPLGCNETVTATWMGPCLDADLLDESASSDIFDEFFLKTTEESMHEIIQEPARDRCHEGGGPNDADGGSRKQEETALRYLSATPMEASPAGAQCRDTFHEPHQLQQMSPTLGCNETATVTWMGPCLDASLLDESASSDIFDEFFLKTTEESMHEIIHEPARDRCQEEGGPNDVDGGSRTQEDTAPGYLSATPMEASLAGGQCRDTFHEPHQLQQMSPTLRCNETATATWMGPCLDAGLLDESASSDIFDEFFLKATGESMHESIHIQDPALDPCQEEEGPNVVDGGSRKQEQQAPRYLSATPTGSPACAECRDTFHEDKDPNQLQQVSPTLGCNETGTATWMGPCLDAGLLDESASSDIFDEFFLKTTEESMHEIIQEPARDRCQEKGGPNDVDGGSRKQEQQAPRYLSATPTGSPACAECRDTFHEDKEPHQLQQMSPPLGCNETATATWMGPCLDAGLLDESASSDIFDEFFLKTTEESMHEIIQEPARDRFQEEVFIVFIVADVDNALDSDDFEEMTAHNWLSARQWTPQSRFERLELLATPAFYEDGGPNDVDCGHREQEQQAPGYLSATPMEVSPACAECRDTFHEDKEPHQLQQMSPTLGCYETTTATWMGPCLDAGLLDESASSDIFDEFFLKTTEESMHVIIQEPARDRCQEEGGPNDVDGGSRKQEQQAPGCLSATPMGSPAGAQCRDTFHEPHQLQQMPSPDSDDTVTSSWMGPCLDTSLFDESASCETFEQFFRTTMEGSSCEMTEKAARARCYEEGEPSGAHGESREQEDGEAPLLQRCEWESREQEDGEVPLLQRCEWHMSVEQMASPEKEDHPTMVDEDGEPYKVQEVTSAGCDEAAAVEWSAPCLDTDLFDDSVSCEIFDEIIRKTTGESVREDTLRGLCKNDEIAADPSGVNGAEGEEEQEPQCCQNEQVLSLMPMGSPGRTEHPAVDYEEKDPCEIPPRQSDEGLAASWSEVCLDAGVLYEDASDELPEDLLRHLREEPTRQEPRLSSSDEEDAAGESCGADNQKKAEEQQRPFNGRRKRRAVFKSLGSTGRPYYRAEPDKRMIPYVCHRCQCKFKFKRDLEYHVAEHTGRPLLPCEFCPRTFPTGRMLSCHRVIKHGCQSLSAKRRKVAWPTHSVGLVLTAHSRTTRRKATTEE